MPAPIEISKRADQTLPATSPSTNNPAHRVGTFISDGTLEHEDPSDLAIVYAEYLADYRPTPGIETELVRQLAMATHRLRRLDRIENAALYDDATAHTRHEANLIISEAFDRTWGTIEKILKARAAAERSFNRVYQDLEARKALRTAPRETPAKLEIEVDTRHNLIPSTKPARDTEAFEVDNQPPATDNSAPTSPRSSRRAARRTTQPQVPPTCDR